jgi:hypothetical protein
MSDSPPPIHVYIHAAAMGDHWREIVAELVGMVEGSGLGDVAATKRLVLVGQGPTRYLASRGWDGWETVESAEGVDQYEYPTLRRLWEHAQEAPAGLFLYLHTKGASSPAEGQGAYAGKRHRDRWRRLMAYHLVACWRDRLADLAEADTVGCFPIGGPLPHYAGNFWWAQGYHLARLPEPAPMHPLRPGGEHPRLWAELWLQSIPGKYAVCYQPAAGMKGEFIAGAYRRHRDSSHGLVRSPRGGYH